MRIRKTLLAAVILGASMATTEAQTTQSGADIPQKKDFVCGKVTAVNKDSFAVTRGGETVVVKLNEHTAIREQTQQQPVKLEPRTMEDIKPGGTIAAVGTFNGNVLEAARILINPMPAEPSTPASGGGVIGGIIAVAKPLDMVLVLGKVAAINKDSMTLTRLEDGETVIVKVNEHTRIVKQTQVLPGKDGPAKLEGIKATDMIVARGLLKDGVLEATKLFVNPVMGSTPEIRPEDMGKTFICGQVRAVHGGQLSIERTDRALQEIGVDEKTSFRWLSEYIAFQDIRVGDVICGPGELKDGIFVAKMLNFVSAEDAAGKGIQPQEQKYATPARPALPK